MDKFSYLSNVGSAWLDDLYQQYQKDPSSVETGWARFFEGFEFARSAEGGDVTAATAKGAPAPGGNERFEKEFRVVELINAYRQRGHFFTKTNPVRDRRTYMPTLALENFGLGDADLDTVFSAGNEVGIGPSKLRDILDLLKQTYCQSIGAEFMFIRDPEKVRWLQQRMEGVRNTPDFSIGQKKAILEKLNEAVVFERFLGKKFIGAKRFSIEGAEALIPALDTVIEHGAELGITEYVIGMAHRGRLNVLANIVRNRHDQILKEFDRNVDPETIQGSGDVKYHLGTEGTFTSMSGKQIPVYLAANPSHLEAVNGVLEGIVRAKQDRTGDGEYGVMPILVHGDASFSGQGVVVETIQMSQLRAYKTGGTVHVVINNQVGFTTPPSEAHSSVYATDVAKTIQAPVFHVNGDDPEAVTRVAEHAFAYRQQFKRDVVIDLVCYRRRGHNEGDDPSMTQPLMYNLIEAKRSVRNLYTEALVGRGDLTQEEYAAAHKDFQERLERAFAETHAAQTGAMPIVSEGSADDKGDAVSVASLDKPAAQQADATAVSGEPESTAIDPSVVALIGDAHDNPPAGFTVHPK
ncbi:MAG: 2-oxoglutarate dehydrogenase E1 component, partial [Flavobacteriales bacterium]|nr:2-oxoglutarate dehydrogenase E1 component [Flavobacteriales bacterium]